MGTIRAMNEQNSGERVRYSISVSIEVPNYQSTRYLPNALVMKFDKKQEETKEAIQQHVEHPIRVDNKISDEKIGLDTKLRLFFDIFNTLTEVSGKNDIQKKILIDELINTGRTLRKHKMVTLYLKEGAVNTPPRRTASTNLCMVPVLQDLMKYSVY